MSAAVSIERLNSDTLPAWLSHCLAIDRDSFREPWTEAQWRLDLPAKWELSRVALDREGAVAGYCVASQKGSTVHVHRLAVARSNRRLGVGTKLILSVAKEALGLRLDLMTLCVEKGNLAAFAFYCRLGFAFDHEKGGSSILSVLCGSLCERLLG